MGFEVGCSGKPAAARIGSRCGASPWLQPLGSGWQLRLPARDTRRKLPLGIFLDKMQELHQDVRQRVKQLERGVPPNARPAQYVQNDANLQMAKDSLGIMVAERSRTGTRPEHLARSSLTPLGQSPAFDRLTDTLHIYMFSGLS